MLEEQDTRALLSDSSLQGPQDSVRGEPQCPVTAYFRDHNYSDLAA